MCWGILLIRQFGRTKTSALTPPFLAFHPPETGQESQLKLHIGNLPKTVTEQQLREMVTPFGEVSLLEIAKDSGGSSKGFAFAEFPNDEHARAAISGLNGKTVSDRQLKVSEARPRRTDQQKQTTPPQRA